MMPLLEVIAIVRKIFFLAKRTIKTSAILPAIRSLATVTMMTLLPSTKVITDKSALQIVDSRTGLEYDIPIKINAVRAVIFKHIKATKKEAVTKSYDYPHDDLRILDSGSGNTAVPGSKITFVNVKVPFCSLLKLEGQFRDISEVLQRRKKRKK